MVAEDAGNKSNIFYKYKDAIAIFLSILALIVAFLAGGNSIFEFIKKLGSNHSEFVAKYTCVFGCPSDLSLRRQITNDDDKPICMISNRQVIGVWQGYRLICNGRTGSLLKYGIRWQDNSGEKEVWLRD